MPYRFVSHGFAKVKKSKSSNARVRFCWVRFEKKERNLKTNFKTQRYEDFVTMIAEIAIRTPSIKTLILVTPHAKIVTTVGLYDAEDSDGAIKIGGMKMPSGVSYPAFIIPMTSAKKEKVKQKLRKMKTSKITSATSSQDLT